MGGGATRKSRVLQMTVQALREVSHTDLGEWVGVKLSGSEPELKVKNQVVGGGADDGKTQQGLTQCSI